MKVITRILKISLLFAIGMMKLACGSAFENVDPDTKHNLVSKISESQCHM